MLRLLCISCINTDWITILNFEIFIKYWTFLEAWCIWYMQDQGGKTLHWDQGRYVSNQISLNCWYTLDHNSKVTPFSFGKTIKLFVLISPSPRHFRFKVLNSIFWLKYPTKKCQVILTWSCGISTCLPSEKEPYECSIKLTIPGKLVG